MDSDTKYLPRHIAIVENAYKENLFAGEQFSSLINVLGTVISECLQTGISYLTVNFSNSALLTSLKETTSNLVECSTALGVLLQKQKTSFVRSEGDSPVYPSCSFVIKKKEEAPLILTLSLSEGRKEILETVKKLLKKGDRQEEVTEKDFLSSLPNSQFPDPDYIIVTGKERCFPDFRIWQSAYAEYFFTQTPLYKFTLEYFRSLLENFISRRRNFGK